ncbi:MAG: hypothetical protein WBP44_11780 [Gammaproteobacteria bacterium]|jgi:hypothetical protein
MEIDHSGDRKIPVILLIDVEPDPFLVNRFDPEPWRSHGLAQWQFCRRSFVMNQEIPFSVAQTNSGVMNALGIFLTTAGMTSPMVVPGNTIFFIQTAGLQERIEDYQLQLCRVRFFPCDRRTAL